MDGLAKAGHIDEAKSIFDEMKEKSVRSGMFPVTDWALKKLSLKHQIMYFLISDSNITKQV